jgi:hydroxymethylbilane synthase
MHHRPSAERISAERSFADAVAQQADYAVGALASLSNEGDLSLFGAISHQHETLVIQAEISGEASEAQTLGKELAQDVLEQAKARS